VLRFPVIRAFVAAGVSLALVGCATHAPRPTTRPTPPFSSDRIYWPAVLARVDPPPGWRADAVKASAQHAHQVWVSPTGDTAYGVIHFTLPLPVGHEWSLVGFLQNMKKSEGEATLVGKKWDADLPGLRFVADGGLYRVRTNLQVRGMQGWATYAGTLRAKPINEAELQQAESAREGTVVGAEK